MPKGPYLARIRVYPFKGLDPQEVTSARLTPEGALEHDREFALFDEKGKPVSGKREKKLFLVRSFVDFEREEFRFRYGQREYAFSFSQEQAVSEFFSELLGYRVTLKRGLFPDDRKALGPTVVCRESIKAVASWFGFSEEEARRRFRTNLELENCPPFYEDALFKKLFSVGKALFRGEGISRRCPVPARHPETGEEYPAFRSLFEKKRRETLPPYSPPEAFKDTFYRFTLNTVTLKPALLRLGDELVLQEP
ncbi:MAG: MOSC domain-containing protein [Aquificae bacterium]|nr:MOSC domain-containing protein [Aquificota bacterium]